MSELNVEYRTERDALDAAFVPKVEQVVFLAKQLSRLGSRFGGFVFTKSRGPTHR
jgi:hypothetical protein